MELNKFIDHTFLKAFGQEQIIKDLCKEAVEYNFKSVCVNPYYIPLAKKELQGSDVLVCTVIGFPLGQNTTETKVFETKDALEKGADEIDMVINIAALKDRKDDYVLNEIKLIKNECKDKTLKVIIETCYLTEEEKKFACELSVKAGADFVKTSTGFGTGGATLSDVELMSKTVNKQALVKASGGVSDKETALKMVEAGASRIGTSKGKEIVK